MYTSSTGPVRVLLNTDSGEYALMAIPSSRQNLTTSLWCRVGWSSIWLMAGGILAILRTMLKSSTSKLETPMDCSFPAGFHNLRCDKSYIRRNCTDVKILEFHSLYAQIFSSFSVRSLYCCRGTDMTREVLFIAASTLVGFYSTGPNRRNTFLNLDLFYIPELVASMSTSSYIHLVLCCLFWPLLVRSSIRFYSYKSHILYDLLDRSGNKMDALVVFPSSN